MTNDVSNKTLSAILLGACIIAFAAGLIVYSVTDYGILIILWVTLLIAGILISIIGSMYAGDATAFGPSESKYRMVIGAVVAIIGLIGTLHEVTDFDTLILIAIGIIAIVIVGIIAAVTKDKGVNA